MASLAGDLERRNAQAAEVVVAIVGVDLAIAERLALVADAVDEGPQGQATPVPPERRSELDPPLSDAVAEELGTVTGRPAGRGGPPPPPPPGAPEPPRCDEYVDRIISRAAQGITGAATAAGIADFAGIAGVFGHAVGGHGLVRAVATVLGGALDHVSHLLGVEAARDALVGFLTSLGNRLGEAVTGPLRQFLQADLVVAGTNACLGRATGSLAPEAVAAMGHVVEEHKKRSRWIGRGGTAARLLLLHLGPGAPLVLVPAAVQAMVAVYFAHDYLDSPRATPLLPDVAEGIPRAVRRVVGC